MRDKIRKIEVILIGILLLALLLRFILVFSSPVRWWDETVYANLGYDLSKNPLDYSLKDKFWSDFIPDGSWPKIGFRPPLLPYILSLIYLFRLDFLINLLMPMAGALTVFMVYLFGRKLFGEKAGLYAALFMAFVPFHVYYSSKILNDVLSTFFMTAALFFFWKGYEEQDKKSSLLFGLFFAFSLLSRYTSLWLLPVFLFFFIIRDKSLKFIRNKYLWYSILLFLIVLVPWFIYGLHEYNNPAGAFLHGFDSSAYWGGVQSWSFFFDYGFSMFSALGILFIISMPYILIKKDFRDRKIYFLLLWIFLFLFIAMLMPHKEDRFILPIAPALCLICGFFIDQIKSYKLILIMLVIAVCSFSVCLNFLDMYQKSHTEPNICFSEANKFLKTQQPSLVITDESPIIYFYSKQETGFYPALLDSSFFSYISDKTNKSVLVLFTEFDMPLWQEKNKAVKDFLDKNAKPIFRCSLNENSSVIYEIPPQ